MYKLTDEMIRNFEKYLRNFHDLLTGGRCEAWQLEEFIVKAIRSDYSKSDRVIWKGRGHDIDKDVQIIEFDGKVNDIQIKSSKILKQKMIVSGHRTGRFKGDLKLITEFLNSNKYDYFIIPFDAKEDENGKKFFYKIFYVESEIFKIDNDWKVFVNKNGGNKYITTNSKNVQISLSPSMSWQVWWEIPIDLLKNHTREIVI